MRVFSIIGTALAVLPVVFAAQKSAIVWFDDPSTPDSIIQQAKNDLIAAGGRITHSYTIIKGFAVTAPETALQTVSAWGEEHKMRVEEDDVVTVDE